jgi:hypothetical protein
MGALIRLHAGLLIGTHYMHALRVQLGRVLIQRTNGLDGCVEWLRSLGARVIEPVTGLMGFEVRCVLKNGRDCEATCC